MGQLSIPPRQFLCLVIKKINIAPSKSSPLSVVEVEPKRNIQFFATVHDIPRNATFVKPRKSNFKSNLVRYICAF